MGWRIEISLTLPSTGAGYPATTWSGYSVGAGNGTPPPNSISVNNLACYDVIYTRSRGPLRPLIAEIRAIYGPGPIPLHRPVFEGPERRWLVDCIDSNFVSSVGARVTEFEERLR